MKRAAIYARFSSDKQNERSIDDQVALCSKVCERGGFVVEKLYDDRALSGASTLTRPGWQRLMRDAAGKRFDYVVIEDLDRAFRNQADYHAARNRLKFLDVELHDARGVVGLIEGSIRALQSEMYLENLAAKTHRGQTGAVTRGRHVGPPPFGYRIVQTEAGEPNALEIDGVTAAVVRRIYADYLAGQSARDIAAALNAAQIPGPRGGPWNASAIGGSRKRMNGILQNALYVGEIVWNRQRFIKNPDTGKRVSRPNPESEWVRSETPHLRIIDQATWSKVQARRADRGGKHRYHATRPRHLLSGLLKCGCCGSSYTVSGADKRGAYLRCSRMVETGLCDNRRTVGLLAIERQVIEGIEKHLAAPDLIAEYVREFHRALRELNDGKARRRSDLGRRLASAEADIKRTVDLLVKGYPIRALKERLAELEAERTAVEADLAALAPPPTEFHPNVAENYRRKVADLKAALLTADEANRADAFRVIRELVERIVIRPRGPYRPVDIEIHGRLAALLQASTGALDCTAPESRGVMVAGVGFEPTTFRL
jgi:site-specific DNA recombinase